MESYKLAYLGLVWLSSLSCSILYVDFYAPTSLTHFPSFSSAKSSQLRAFAHAVFLAGISIPQHFSQFMPLHFDFLRKAFYYYSNISPSTYIPILYPRFSFEALIPNVINQSLDFIDCLLYLVKTSTVSILVFYLQRLAKYLAPRSIQ